MRTSNISFRVEPETARGLVWLTNKYNYEHTATYTKTDMIETFIKAALKDEDFLELALLLADKSDDYASYEIYLESKGGK